MLNGFKILTITHRQAPLSQIGRYVIPHGDEAALKNRLEQLKSDFQISELMYLATCNRVLFFFYSEQPLDPAFTARFIQTYQPDISTNNIEKQAILLEGIAAVKHFYHVAASVDSLVVGEREILRQLREAYDACHQWEFTGDNLRLAVEGAIVAAKEVYGNTRLGEKSVSVVSLAIKELLKTHLPKSARFLMIGAGQTNLLMAKFLKKNGYHHVAVFNRTLEKGQQIATMLGGKALPLHDLKNYREGFDCLITCTGATEPIVDKSLYINLLNGESGRKTLVDLSVPSNIDKEIARQFDVHFIEIENLKTLAQENLAFREQEVIHATELLDFHLAEFEAAARRRRIERAFHRIPSEVKAVRERAMQEVFHKEIASLDENTQRLLDRMMTYMEKKCAGIPMKIARETLVA